MEHRGMIILSGSSHAELAQSIARHLDVRLGSSSVYHKHNRETMVEIQESVRGKDVYIIQTGTKQVNDSIMELLIMCYACKTSSCNRVIGVIPYMPYSRQTKMRRRGNISLKLLAQMLAKGGFDHIITVDLHSKESLGFFDCAIDNVRASPFLLQYISDGMMARGAITCKLLAKLLVKSGVAHVITMDLHQKEIQGFFDCPVDNLRASPFLVRYIQESIPDYRNAVIVAKNPLAARRATSYAERLRLGIAVIHGEVKDGDEDELDGRASPPRDEERDDLMNRVTTVGATLPPLTAKEKPPINVVGDVGGKIAIMVDDLIDDVQSFVDAAHVLKERGAYKIYALATHGILSKEAPRLIEESPIDEVVVTNTVPHDLQKLQCHKIKTVDISILLAEAIRRIHNKESMSHLFRHVTLED